MLAQARPWGPLQVLLVALMVLPAIAVFSSLTWIKQQPDNVGFLITGVASALTVISSYALGILVNRRTDEWHKSAVQFSSRWGWSGGAALLALLLALPPFRDAVVDFVASNVDAPLTQRKPIMLAFVFGFMAVVATQAVLTVLLSIGWTAWMSRKPRHA